MIFAVLGALVPTSAPAQVVPSPDEAAVQKHLGLFLTRMDRRDVGERVVRSQDRLELWFLRQVGDVDREQTLCDGFRWLLAGRLAASDGIKALFAALPGINEVVLVFYEVETRIEPQADGRYRQTRSAGPRARFAITRERALELNPAAIAGALAAVAGCVKRGESMVTTFWAR